jgi:hypothetical protein
VVRCSDCGGDLKDVWEDDSQPLVAAPAEPTLPEGEYRVIAASLTSATAGAMVKRLAAAAIPAKVVPTRYGELDVRVRDEERERAESVLLAAGLLSEVPEAIAVAVAVEGGPCPACGESVPPGASECRSCGLGLGGDLPVCEGCGAEMPIAGRCAQCGQWPRPDRDE